jgi:hypothetical protein
MTRTGRRTRNPKSRSSASVVAKKKPSRSRKSEPEEENVVLKPRDGNIDNEPSSPLSSPEDKATTRASKQNGNGRPPLPRKRANDKAIEKESDGDEDEDEESIDVIFSPLQKKKLLSRASATITTAASTPGRPRRRAAAAAKKHYADIDSATDKGTSSSDESDYGETSKRRSRAQPIARKNEQHTKKLTAARKNSKRKTKTPPPATRKSGKAFPGASLTSKITKSSPSVLSTPRGATIGLTSIQDSVSKVWKSDGGDWRVHGAIDYDEF